MTARKLRDKAQIVAAWMLEPSRGAQVRQRPLTAAGGDSEGVRIQAASPAGLRRRFASRTASRARSTPRRRTSSRRCSRREAVRPVRAPGTGEDRGPSKPRRSRVARTEFNAEERSAPSSRPRSSAAQSPTSVRAGDAAMVRADGTIEGFVGGACAETSVRLHALRVLETGEPVLLRILPGGAEGEAAAEDGAVTVKNPCLSGGALEIFLEPHLPAATLRVVGKTPIALALADLGSGWATPSSCSAPEEANPAPTTRPWSSHRTGTRRSASSPPPCARACHTWAWSPARVAAMPSGSRSSLPRSCGHSSTPRRDWRSGPRRRRRSPWRSSPRSSPCARRCAAPTPAARARPGRGARRRGAPRGARARARGSGRGRAGPRLRHGGRRQRRPASSSSVNGERYYFCTEGCRDSFAAEERSAVAGVR